MINWALKRTITERFGTQVNAARKLGLRESRLSYLVRGHTKPSVQERAALSQVLGEECVRELLDMRESE